MIVAVHQPNYLPYLGFFHKMARAHTFILYDTAQYSKNELHNRNRIKTPKGVQWLTVPVRRRGFQPIREVEIDTPSRWSERHQRAIEANYRRAPHYESYAAELHSTLRGQWHHLADLNEALIQQVARWLSIETKLVRSSSLPGPHDTDPTEKLLHLARSCGGSVYLSGPGGHGYLREEKFDSVRLRYTHFVPAPYPQLFGQFVPNLSVIDALFNCGELTRNFIL